MKTLLALAILTFAVGASPVHQTYALRSAEGLDLKNVKAQEVSTEDAAPCG